MNKITFLTILSFVLILISQKTKAQITALFEKTWTIQVPTEKKRIEHMSKSEKKEYLSLSKKTRMELQQELETQAENSSFAIKIDGTFDIDIKNYMQQKGIWRLDREDPSILHITYQGGEQDGEKDKILIKELTEERIILKLEQNEVTEQELVLVPKQ